MAGYIDLIVDKGATFSTTITLKDDVSSNVINISGYTITSKIRKSYYSANADAQFTCIISDAANGVVTLSLSAANTINLKPGKYVFDILSSNTSNVVTKILEGKVIVTPLATF